jgi:hypothetical protein
MSYWVMFIDNDNLYMAADRRVSTHGNGHLFGNATSNYADTAEKLCVASYSARNGYNITIGITIMSGAASFSHEGRSVSVTDVTKMFIKHVEENGIYFQSAVDANNGLLAYAQMRFPNPINETNSSPIKRMSGFLQQQYFGVGLHNGSFASLARNVNMQCLDETRNAYMEARTDSKHLQELFPKQQQRMFNINTIADIKQSELRRKDAYKLAADIIFLGKHDRVDPKDRYSNRTQVVSSEFDFAHITRNGIVQLIKGPKVKLSESVYKIPFYAGSDRVAIQPVTAVNYDLDPSRQSICTRRS